MFDRKTYMKQYNKQWCKNNPDYHKKYSKQLDPVKIQIKNKRRILFKNKQLYIKERILIGVCNLCRAVVGLDCKRTSMHHIEYHEEDILKDTIELCNSCHKTLHHNNNRIDDY